MIDFLGAPAWSNPGPNPIITGNTSITGAVQMVTALRTAHGGQPATYVLYAATVNGGVWRCDNFVDAMLPAAGRPLPAIQWIPLTDQSPTMSICSVALDPFDPAGNTVWAGTGGLSSGFFNRPALGLLKTTNGRSQNPAWNVMGADLAGQRIISVAPASFIDPATKRQVILVAAFDGRGILRSNDGGQTFQAVIGPAGPLAGRATDLIVDPNDPQTFYAAISANFQNQNLVSTGGIFRSRDGGVHWQQIDGGIPQVGRSVSLKLAIFNNAAGAVAGAGRTVLYVGQSDTTGRDNNLIGLFRSGNPTANRPQWATIFFSPNPAVVPSGLIAAQWPVSSNIPWFAMAVDPADWNNMYLGGMSWLYRVRIAAAAGGRLTTRWAQWDAGGGWDHRSLTYIASNILIGTGDPGIFGLANNGNTWTSLNHSLAVTEFYSVAFDESRGVVCGGAQDVGSPVESGGGWIQLPQGGGDGALALVGTDGVYYFQRDGTVLRDSNGNVTTPAGITTLISIRCMAVNPANPQQLMACPIQPALLLESPDHGDHVRDITPVGLSRNVSAIAYGADNPSAVYVGTSSGQLFLRTNGNGPPARVPNYPGQAHVGDIAVDRTDWRKAAMFGLDGGVFFTADAGGTWANIQGNSGDLVQFMRKIEIVTAGPNVVVLIAGDSPDSPAGNSGVARTVNPGANANVVWTPFGTGLPRVNFTDLRYYPAGQLANGDLRGDLLLAGSYGRGAWTIADPCQSIINTINDLEGQISARIDDLTSISAEVPPAERAKVIAALQAEIRRLGQELAAAEGRLHQCRSSRF
jgi:photosystem II stability/assembly factor-like uncharacterized protein